MVRVAEKKYLISLSNVDAFSELNSELCRIVSVFSFVMLLLRTFEPLGARASSAKVASTDGSLISHTLFMYGFFRGPYDS